MLALPSAVARRGPPGGFKGGDGFVLRLGKPPVPSRCITFAEGVELTETEAWKRLQGGD